MHPAVAKTFFRGLLRNYVFGSTFAVLCVGVPFLFFSLSLLPSEQTILLVCALISTVIMVSSELITFHRHARPIKNAFFGYGSDLEVVRKAYNRVRIFPMLAVRRILLPHWLGLMIPATLLTTIANLMGALKGYGIIEICIVFVASFCVACMHALVEYYLNEAACRKVLVYIRDYALQTFQTDLSQGPKVQATIRRKLILTAISIGTLPMLLFSMVVAIRLSAKTSSLSMTMTGYIQWTGFFFIVGMAFSLTAAWLLARAIETPIVQLKQGIERIQRRELNQFIDDLYSDEFSVLVQGYNQMVLHIAERENDNRQLIDSYLSTLATALDARDSYTAGHSLRVAHFALKIGELAECNELEMEHLRRSSLLHDIGKIGVPDAVLLKQGELSESEFALIKTHPVIGEQILRQIEPKETMEPLLPGVRSHHERYDGNGYPDGLRAEDIPELGRIIAVADAFDAMTSDRPYRRGMDVEMALSILERGAGSQWDPRYARLFVTWMRENAGHYFKNTFGTLDVKAQ